MPFEKTRRTGSTDIYSSGDESPKPYLNEKMMNLFKLMVKSARRAGEDDDSIAWTVRVDSDGYRIWSLLEDNYGRYGGILYYRHTPGRPAAFLLLDERNIYNFKKHWTMMWDGISYSEAKQIAKRFFD